MRKLNILYHHRTQGRGAEGTHIVSIIRGFEDLGHRVTLVSPPGIDPLKDVGAPPVDKTKVKTKGIQRVWKFISMHVPNPVFELIEIAYNIPAVRRLEKIVKQEKFDFIFERYAFYLIAGSHISKKHGIPLVVEANEVSGIDDRARKQSFTAVCNWFEKKLFSQAKAVFTVSSQLRSMITAKGVALDKVYVLPNAIDTRLVKVSSDIDELRKIYGLTGKTVVGFAGWFDQWDRLDFLLDVYKDLRRERGNVAILLVGDGPAVENIKKIVEQEGMGDSVILTGAVPKKEIFNYLSLIDIAILPHSNNFGSPVILFEIMSLKKPVVAPRLPPIEDVLTDGKNALLFEPLNKEDCLDALLRFIDSKDLRNSCAESGYELLIQEHTWVNNSRKIVNAAMKGSR